MSKVRLALMALASMGAIASVQPASAQYYDYYGPAQWQGSREYNEVQRRRAERRWLNNRDAEEAARRAWEDQASRRGEIDWGSVVARRRAYDRQMHETRNRILDRREVYDDSAYRRQLRQQYRYGYGYPY
jgi:hypothetical protein